MTFKNQNLPAGLMCQNGEFFVHNNDVFLLKNQKVISFDTICTSIKQKLLLELKTDKMTYSALIDMVGENEEEQIKQFCRCRFGAFDGVPDLVNGELQECEYFECGFRGSCRYEGKICKTIKYNNQKISKREIELVQHIASGYVDKYIADLMGIAESTLNKMKRNLYEKIGAESKVDVVKFALKINLFSIYAN